MEKFNTKEEIRYQLKMSTLSELTYILARFCGPHNVILAEKTYGSYAKELQRMVNDEIAIRQFDEILESES